MIPISLSRPLPFQFLFRAQLPGPGAAEWDAASGMAPSVSVLFWWCEETDHTADGVCNLLWSSQQLGMTSDGTQAQVPTTLCLWQGVE